MICENCGKEFTGKYSKWASGRFCSTKCARGFSTKLKRQEINLKVSLKLREYEEIKPCEVCGKTPEIRYGLGRFCSESCKQSFAASLKTTGGFNNITTQKIALDTQQRQREEKYALMQFEELPKDEIKRRVLCKFNNKCAACGLFEWQNKPIALELHHVDGCNWNNKEENLTILCPNCHSQTENFGNKNRQNRKVEDAVLLHSLLKHNKISKALKEVGLSPKASNYDRCRDLFFKNKYGKF